MSVEGILGLQPRDEAAILGFKTIKFESLRIFMKIELTSQFLTTDMAVVTSRANQEYETVLFLSKMLPVYRPPIPSGNIEEGASVIHLC